MKKYIDLTHTINNNISLFPGTAPPIIEKVCYIKDVGCEVTKIEMDSHTGTHMDAPSHFYEGYERLDEMDISKFIGKAYTYDCTHIIDDEIKKEDILLIEDKLKYIDYLLFFTGNQFYWGKEEYKRNKPRLSREASLWLSSFPIKGIGIDSLSLDSIYADPNKKETYNHHILLKSGKVFIENLTNLDKIKNKIVDFICLPLKFNASDGAPVRAICYLNE